MIIFKTNAILLASSESICVCVEKKWGLDGAVRALAVISFENSSVMEAKAWRAREREVMKI